MPRKPPKPAPVVVKRPPQERKRLTPELEAFAASDQTRLRIRRPAVDQGRVADPREGYAIAGVANRDARAVYGSRVDELRELWNAGAASDADKAVIGERLFDLKRLSLWRARRVMGFDALVEEVLGIPLAQAAALCDAAASRLAEPATELSERDISLWLRTEAGLFEGDPKARATVRSGVLSLSIGLTTASLGLAGAGAKHMPLARAQREAGEAGAGEAAHAEQAERAPRAAEPSVPAGARLLRRKPVAEVVEAEIEDVADDVEDEAEPSEAEKPAPRLQARPERPRRDAAVRPAFQKREGDRAERPRREGARPAFQKREGERPERPRRDGDRPAFQKRDGERPAFQKRDGDRPAFQKRDGERPAFQKRDGDRPAFQKRDGDRPAFQKRDGDRPAFQKRDGDRPAFQKRTGGSDAGAKRPFAKKPAFGKGAQGGAKSFGKGKSFGKSKGFGERKSFGGQGTSGAAGRVANKPFKKKPSDDEG